MTVSMQDAVTLRDTFDPNGDGVLDFAEFSSYYARMQLLMGEIGTKIENAKGSVGHKNIRGQTTR
jgi:hypothetical protein